MNQDGVAAIILMVILVLAGALVIILGLMLHFLPTIVAYGRRHPQTTAIFVLNLFLGWSVVGWVVALVWAFTAFPEEMR